MKYVVLGYAKIFVGDRFFSIFSGLIYHIAIFEEYCYIFISHELSIKNWLKYDITTMYFSPLNLHYLYNCFWIIFEWFLCVTSMYWFYALMFLYNSSHFYIFILCSIIVQKNLGSNYKWFMPVSSIDATVWKILNI